MNLQKELNALEPPRRVKLIEDRGEKLFVTNDDNIRFEPPSDKVTNDLDLAALAARQDAQSQRALAQDMKERMDAYRAGEGEGDSALRSAARC